MECLSPLRYQEGRPRDPTSGKLAFASGHVHIAGAVQRAFPGLYVIAKRQNNLPCRVRAKQQCAQTRLHVFSWSPRFSDYCTVYILGGRLRADRLCCSPLCAKKQTNSASSRQKTATPSRPQGIKATDQPVVRQPDRTRGGGRHLRPTPGIAVIIRPARRGPSLPLHQSKQGTRCGRACRAGPDRHSISFFSS